VGKLKQKLAEKKDFVITCEFVPGRGPKGRSIDAAVEFGKKVAESGLPVDAVSLTDNPGGNPAISPDVLGKELHQLGVEALIHFACSDGNRNILESRAYALSRDGVENLLVVTGDYQTSGFQGVSKPAFDLDSVQLIKYLSEMNAGLTIPGRKKGTTDSLPATDFCIGCVVSPFKKHENELLPQFFKLEKKVRAGAHFIVPQLGYDMRKFAEIIKYMKFRGIDVPILGNVYVLNKLVAGAMNRGLIPGCVVNDQLAAKIKEEAKAEDKGKGAKLERAAQMTAVFKGIGFNGVHIGGFGLKFPDFEHIIRRAQEIGDNWREHVPGFRYGQKDEYFLFPDDPDLTFAPDKMVPRKSVRDPGFTGPFDFSRLMHQALLEEESVGYKIAKKWYQSTQEGGLSRKLSHWFEKMCKVTLYDCQDCGDCSLFDLAYLCPMSQCAKFQRNGPCGGSKDGKCEADEAKPCVWTKVYDRLLSVDGLDYIREQYVPPPDAALLRTSSWANYYLGKDHTAKRLAAAKRPKKTAAPKKKPAAEKADPAAAAGS
jgi:methylenetetrahydrofolate reductase (NADPH)